MQNTKIQVPRQSQISTKFADTVAHCLCHCSHLQISFQWTLCIFYFIREFTTFLLHWLWFPFVLACMKTSFCKAKPYILACVACTLPVPAYVQFGARMRASAQHILSRGNHVPSVLRVGEQSESPVGQGYEFCIASFPGLPRFTFRLRSQ